MPPKGPSDTSDKTTPQHPKENRGLVDKLKNLLTAGAQDLPKRPVSDDLPLKKAAIESLTDEAGMVHGSSDDIGRRMEEIAADRRARGIEPDPELRATQENQAIHMQAIEEISGEKGVAINQDEIEKREAEIRQRRAQEPQNQQGPEAPTS